MVAVITLKTPNSNIFYEVGLARGLGKPVFLIIQDEGTLPIYLKDMVYVKASVKDLEPIAFNLDQFLLQYGKQKKTRVTRLKRPKAMPNIEYLKKDLGKLTKQGTEIEFLSLVTNLLKSENVILNLSHGIEEKGADLSLWIDSLELSLGNPLLVDLKIGDLSESILEKTEEQLRHFLEKTNARVGLLIYFDRKNHHFNRSKFMEPLVIRFEIRNLIEELTKSPIDRVIISERNRIVHGE